MHIPEPNGPYVGLGEGDHSPEIPKVKAKLKAKFTPARNTLDDSDFFDRALTMEVTRVQKVYTNQGKEGAPHYIPGVVNAAFKYDVGLLKRPIKTLPIAFTVEGHLSNQFMGPCAQTASALESQGLRHWKPVGDWNVAAIPFDNKSGVDALYRQLSRNEIEGPPIDPTNQDGPKVMWPFPPGTPWDLVAFSQGAMIACEFMWKHVLPPGAALHYRLKDFHRGLMFGNPRRAKDAVCSWAQDPPDAGTHGIMDKLFDADKEGIGDRWAEHPNDQDMFAEVGDDKTGKDQTAVAKIITEGKFFGPATIVPRVLALLGNPVGEALPAILAAIDAIMFLASNPNPHYSTFATQGDIDWIRG